MVLKLGVLQIRLIDNKENFNSILLVKLLSNYKSNT